METLQVSNVKSETGWDAMTVTGGGAPWVRATTRRWTPAGLRKRGSVTFRQVEGSRRIWNRRTTSARAIRCSMSDSWAPMQARCP